MLASVPVPLMSCYRNLDFETASYELIIVKCSKFLCGFLYVTGYSFSLTWSNGEVSGEVELMYRVQSLGTYERVAPEWMREVIKFSTSMCPVFFNRITRFIDVHH